MAQTLAKAIDDFYRLHVKFPPQRDPRRIAKVLESLQYQHSPHEPLQMWESLYGVRDLLQSDEPEEALANVFVVGTLFETAMDHHEEISRSTIDRIALDYGKAIYVLSTKILRQEFLKAGIDHCELHLHSEPEEPTPFYGLLAKFEICNAKSRKPESRRSILERAQENISKCITNDHRERERHYLTVSHIHLLLAQTHCYTENSEKVGEHINIFAQFFNDGVELFNNSFGDNVLYEQEVQEAITHGHEIITDLLAVQSDARVKDSLTLEGDNVVEVRKYLTLKSRTLSKFFWNPTLLDSQDLAKDLKRFYREDIYRPQLEELALVLSKNEGTSLNAQNNLARLAINKGALKSKVMVTNKNR